MKRNLTNIEQAILNYVWEEIQRLYWNKYQEDFDASYCNYFREFKDIKVIGYNWNDEGDDSPNIVINGRNFWFYKYYGRSMETDGEKLDEQWLEQTLKKLNK